MADIAWVDEKTCKLGQWTMYWNRVPSVREVHECYEHLEDNHRMIQADVDAGLFGRKES